MTNNKPLLRTTKNNILLSIISASLLWLMSATALATEEVEAPLSCDDNCAQNLWAWADEFDIPAEVFPRDKAQLLALQRLDLARTVQIYRYYSDLIGNYHKDLPKISYLPAEIGQLSQLQELYLEGNQLSALPTEIGQLSQLQTLYLMENQLSALPAEIGQLSQLQELYLVDNQLSVLPAEIGQLGQLQVLWVSFNQLSALPPEIGLLSQLRVLNVGNNNLSSLPAEIGQLSQLQKLSVSWNELGALPASITRLSKLSELDIGANSPLNLTPEQEAFIRTVDTVER